MLNVTNLACQSLFNTLNASAKNSYWDFSFRSFCLYILISVKGQQHKHSTVTLQSKPYTLNVS